MSSNFCLSSISSLFLSFGKQAFRRRRACRPPRGRGIPVPVRRLVPAPYNVGAMHFGDAAGSLPISVEALTLLLKNSSPDDHRMVCMQARRRIHTYHISSYIQFGVVLAIC